MLAPKRQVVLLANSLGQGIVPLVLAYVWYLPVSVPRCRSPYLIGIVKKNAIMMIDFAPCRRAQPGPDLARGNLSGGGECPPPVSALPSLLEPV